MRKYVLVILLLMWTCSVKAQNRIIVNQGFNSGSNLPTVNWGNVESQLSSSPEIDGWYTTHSPFDGVQSPIEVWTDGYNSTPAQEGTHFVELNAEEPSRLYQIVYLVNGESIDWEYYHRNRPGGLTVQTIKYSIYSEDGATELYVIDSCNNSTTTSWTQRQGTFVVSVTTGVYQIGFESTEGTSYGNLLDNVSITLDPLVEFASTNHETTEEDGVVPHIVINGRVDNTSTVTVQINSATATSPSDFTYSSLTVNVPAGQYGLADSIAVPFTIINDETVEGDETIEFEIASVTGDLLQQDADGSSSNETTCSFKIVDDDFLAIDLTQFEAKAFGNTAVELIWQTSMEYNSDYFEVQRSTDTQNWIVIGKEQAAGNSSRLRTYRMIDSRPIDGTAFYRLKEVDKDGNFTFSTIISFENTFDDIKIYPNPAKDYIYIQVPDLISIGQIELYDVSGQIIDRYYTKASMYQINVDRLKKGMYFISIGQKVYPLIML